MDAAKPFLAVVVLCVTSPATLLCAGEYVYGIMSINDETITLSALSSSHSGL